MKTIDQCRVSLEFQIKGDDECFPPGDKRVAALNTWLEHAHQGGAYATQHGWYAHVVVASEGRSLSHAESHGERLIGHCVKTLQFPPSTVVSRSVIDANTFVAELEVYGSRELAELLNVSRQRLAQLRAEGTLPEPDAVLAATPVWQRRTIDSFTFGWRRRPGPPPTDTVPDIDMDRLFSSGWVPPRV
jgi:hypothetical protein